MGDDKNNDKYKMRKNGWLALSIFLFLCSLSALRFWVFEFNFVAFLIGGVFVYLAYLSLRKSGVIDTDDDDKKWSGPKDAIQKNESSILPPVEKALVGSSLPAVSLAVPDFNLAGFPFESKAYVMHRFDHVDDATGENLGTREYYYADNKAVLETVKAIAGIEFLIDRVRSEVTGIPELRTEVDRLTPATLVVDESKLPKNSVCLTVKSSEAHNEAPKYPIEVHFYAFDEMDKNGSSGTLGYLNDGKLALAHEAFSVGGKHYDVLYKLSEEGMAIELITLRKSPEEAPRALYRRNDDLR